MPKKCLVPGCRSNYDPPRTNKRKYQAEDKENQDIEKSHVPVFRLPLDVEDKQRWVATIPLIDKEKIMKLKEPVICIKHWPVGFPTKSVNGKIRPVEPPSVFEGVPISQIPTPPSKPRTTKRSTFEVRTTQEDQLDKFLAADKIDWEIVCQLPSHVQRFKIPVTSYAVDGEQWVQSNEFISGIPRFSFKIAKDLTYVAYHIGVKCTVSSLSRNRMYKLNTWSRIEEVIKSTQ